MVLSEAELQQLILAGAAALAGIAFGLLLGILRGQREYARLQEVHRGADEARQLELAAASREISALEAERGQLHARLAEKLDELAELDAELDQQGQRHQALHNKHTRLQTQLEEREEQHSEQITLLKEARDNLKQEFQLLAHRIFEDKGRSFTATNKASLEALLEPFRQQISRFESRVNEVHTESVKGNTALEAEIRKVLDIGLEMNAQATNLATALKGDKKTTGNWGEAQLARTLELAGLMPGQHYDAQAGHTDAEGRRKLPDFVVKLPDNKCLVIDSKVSLVDYDRAISAASDELRSEALKAHAQAVRNHIDDLSTKDYSNLAGLDSPDFVLMFMPIEPAYIEAMKHNRDLFNYGYQKQVVMVSHTTLMPILRTVANLWMIDQSNREAREISARAGEIYNQVCLVAQRMHRLGKTLQSANNHYNDTVRGLAGQQGLHGKIERFRQLSAKASKKLTELDPIHADIELEKLQAIELTQLETQVAESGQDTVRLEVVSGEEGSTQ